MIMALPIVKGLQASYQAIATKDPGLLYLLTDAQEIRLGDNLIANAGSGAVGKLVQDVTFDETTNTFVFTYTDATTLSVDLALESVFSSIQFNPETKILTVTTVGGATTDIDLTSLIDTVSVEDTNSIDLTYTAGTIKADAKISAKTGNIITIEDDGFFATVTEPDLSIGTF
jgi:hypothetical protein